MDRQSKEEGQVAGLCNNDLGRFSEEGFEQIVG